MAQVAVALSVLRTRLLLAQWASELNHSKTLCRMSGRLITAYNTPCSTKTKPCIISSAILPQFQASCGEGKLYSARTVCGGSGKSNSTCQLVADSVCAWRSIFEPSGSASDFRLSTLRCRVAVRPWPELLMLFVA